MLFIKLILLNGGICWFCVAFKAASRYELKRVHMCYSFDKKRKLKKILRTVDALFNDSPLQIVNILMIYTLEQEAHELLFGWYLYNQYPILTFDNLGKYINMAIYCTDSRSYKR